MRNLLHHRLLSERLILFLSGIATAFAFTFPQLSWVIWLSLTPAIYLFFRVDQKQLFRSFFLFGFSFYTALLSWLLTLYPLDWLGITGIKGFFLLLAGWLFLSAYEAFGIALIGFLWKRFRQKTLLGVIALASLWIMMEYIQGQGILGFTWGRLAISQYNSPALIQSASVFGSLLISFLIVSVNGLLALAITRKPHFNVNKAYLGLAVLIFLSNLFFGVIRLSQPIEPKGEATVAIIQGNILAEEKWEENSVQSILDTYVSLTKETKEFNPDLILWPETAVPVDITNSPSILKAYQELAQEMNSYFFFGGFERKDGNKYNAVSGISPDGELLPNSYYKQHLVPLGEFVPYKDTLLSILPVLGEINRLDDDISPGNSSNIQELSFGSVGSLICFESIFPQIPRQSTLDGAEALLLVTNDSWYGDSPGIYQHNAQAVLRAVENHRSVIRAANTGISTFIDANGYIVDYIPALADGTLIQEVKLYDHLTVYSRIGDIIVLLGIVPLFLCWRKRAQ